MCILHYNVVFLTGHIPAECLNESLGKNSTESKPKQSALLDTT